MMCQFIAEHRARFGVAPICRVFSGHGWKIAPRTYYAWQSRSPSKRALWDMTITEILAGYYEPDEDGRRRPESLYGSLKMWAHLRREGIQVARCTIERLMGANGWQGVTRTKKVRTTIADPADKRAPDLVDRQFKTKAPNQLVVADFTYVPMTGGWHAYTAFVVDAYADTIVGWECSETKETRFVESVNPSGHRLAGTAGHTDRRGHPPLRRRIPIHVGAFRRNPVPRRAHPLDRVGRRRLRQRPVRNDHRPVQDRMHPARITVPYRAVAHRRRPRTDNRSLGPLV